MGKRPFCLGKTAINLLLPSVVLPRQNSLKLFGSPGQEARFQQPFNVCTEGLVARAFRRFPQLFPFRFKPLAKQPSLNPIGVFFAQLTENFVGSRTPWFFVTAGLGHAPLWAPLRAHLLFREGLFLGFYETSLLRFGGNQGVTLGVTLGMFRLGRDGVRDYPGTLASRGSLDTIRGYLATTRASRDYAAF